MKVVLQRVKEASVWVDQKMVGRIGRGVCLLVGIERGDLESDARYLAKKIAEMRIFPDASGKMNLSLIDIPGQILAISQFTLAGSVRRGRRPSFDGAEAPEKAACLFDFFVDQLRAQDLKVETGVFGAMMDVGILNDGPVTFILSRPHRS